MRTAPCKDYGPVDRRPGAIRDWRICLNPEQPLGPSVCKCNGCGSKCRGYVAKPDWDPEEPDE